MREEKIKYAVFKRNDRTGYIVDYVDRLIKKNIKTYRRARQIALIREALNLSMRLDDLNIRLVRNG